MSVPVNDTTALARIQEAFSGLPRPEHFTDYRHCCECAEHDALLLSRDPATLTIGDVGNPGWDPLCFISEEGPFTVLPPPARPRNS